MIVKEERIGGQRLILGDCLSVMPMLGRFDAVVTDPPYGIGADEAAAKKKASGDGRITAKANGTAKGHRQKFLTPSWA